MPRKVPQIVNRFKRLETLSAMSLKANKLCYRLSPQEGFQFSVTRETTCCPFRLSFSPRSLFPQQGPLSRIHTPLSPFFLAPSPVAFLLSERNWLRYAGRGFNSQYGAGQFVSGLASLLQLLRRRYGCLLMIESAEWIAPTTVNCARRLSLPD